MGTITSESKEWDLGHSQEQNSDLDGEVGS